MSKVSLRRLGMIECSMSNSPPSWPDSKRSNIILSSWSVSVFSCFIDNLIESRKDVVSKLNLSNCSVASCCQSISKSNDTLFSKRSVEDTINSVPFAKIHGASEYTTKFDILSEYFGAWLGSGYVGSVSRAISMAELTAWKRFQWVRY